MKIKFQKILSGAIVPSYAHPGDAGMDIFSAEDIVLETGKRKNIRTGLKMELPKGYVVLIWDKSGLAFEHGIKTMAGVIDCGYRGEIEIVLVNLSDKDYRIERGKKIAQMIIQKIETAKIEIAGKLNDTLRSEGGFGSTGV